MSALLGASGGNTDFNEELVQAGAVMGVGDDVFAVSAYCPITNLENSDMAYEWQFNGINHYQKMNVAMLDYNVKRERVNEALTDEQIKWSNELKQLFPNYINSLNLIGHDGRKLTLDNQGNGTFKDEIIYYINRSANTAFKKGINLNDIEFLAQKKSNNPYYMDNYQDYLNYLGRGKGTPAFNDIYLSSSENNLFGNKIINSRHFTSFEKKYGQGQMAESQTIKMMNAMNYIKSSPTKYWRIRHGTKDSDTSLVIPVILATTLSNQGKNVDFALSWGIGHSGDYDLEELFAWTDSVVKSNP